MRDGGYYWNLAWFSWRVEVFIEELSRHAPRHLTGLRKVVRKTAQPSRSRDVHAAA